MDLETVTESEVSQKEKKRYCLLLTQIGRIWKNNTNDLICKVEIEMQTQRPNIWTPWGEAGGGMNWEIGTDV